MVSAQEKSEVIEKEKAVKVAVSILIAAPVVLYPHALAFTNLGAALYLGTEFFSNPIAASKSIERASNKDKLYSESNPSPAPHRVAESNPSPAPQRVVESNPSPAPYRIAESNPSPAPAALLYALEFLGIKPAQVAESRPLPVPRKKV